MIDEGENECISPLPCNDHGSPFLVFRGFMSRSRNSDIPRPLLHAELLGLFLVDVFRGLTTWITSLRLLLPLGPRVSFFAAHPALQLPGVE